MNMEMIIGIIAIVLAVVVGIVIKKSTSNFRRPNGKRGGGLASFHSVVAFAILTTVWLSTRDVFVTILTAILTVSICKQRMSDDKHYAYQIILGGIIGTAVVYSIFFVYDRRPLIGISLNMDSFYSSKRDRIEHMPNSAVDDRNEADSYPDLKLDDI
jgi:hypothetical protein